MRTARITTRRGAAAISDRPRRGASFLRTLATPAAIETWSLTSLRERLIKTGARHVRHARHAVFRFADAALPREVFAVVLDLINGLRGPPAVRASA